MKNLSLAIFVISLLVLSQSAMAGNIVYGVNAHNGWTTQIYKQSDEEAVFQMLDNRNIRSYRVDISIGRDWKAILTRLVALGKKHNIVIRPMLYVDGDAFNNAYKITKEFAKDIPVWELGNELNLKGVNNFDANIRMMIAARQGVMRASADTKIKIQTSINVTSGLNNIGLNDKRTSYPFLDRAIEMGLQFDYITYHYYPSSNDRASGWMKTYLQPLRQYNKKILLNEMNCAEIYKGDDGNSDACAKTFTSLISEIKTNYSDIVAEVNAYELLDNVAISGPEAHFGLMFAVNSPKVTLGILAKSAEGSVLSSNIPDMNIKFTPERAFVDKAFKTVLQRNADEPGLDYWAVRMEKEQISKLNMIKIIASSPEYQKKIMSLNNTDFVKKAFTTILGRQVDMLGLDFYVKNLNLKLLTKEKVLNSILTSAELKNRLM